MHTALLPGTSITPLTTSLYPPSPLTETMSGVSCRRHGPCKVPCVPGKVGRQQINLQIRHSGGQIPLQLVDPGGHAGLAGIEDQDGPVKTGCRCPAGADSLSSAFQPSSIHQVVRHTVKVLDPAR